MVNNLYRSAIIFNQFEGLNLTLTALKTSNMKQLNNEFLPFFYRLRLVIALISIYSLFHYLVYKM
ncbi:MAG TPA: hypothetical protein ENH67_16470 [Pseudoalteromonas sp.]|nr:hypothetical protein [Pseudoalteromonas sp.]HDZ34444.1 hypothetical protein [Pseudoalteromonas sp.]